MMNNIQNKNFGRLVFLILLIYPGLATPQSIEIYDISPDQVVSKGFLLEKSGGLEIEATVGDYRSKNIFLSNCWILDAGTREVVWKFTNTNVKRKTKDK